MAFPFPGYVQFYPTVRCNQHCSFCFNRRMPLPSESLLPDISYAKALRLLDILYAAGIREVDIMGGEPFLIDWMPRFIRCASGKNIAANVSTNGSIGDTLSGLKGSDPKQVTVGISIEGSTRERHSSMTNSSHYDKAVRSIETLVSLGISPVVKTVVSRSTMHDIPNIIDLIRDPGINRYYVIHMDVMSDNPSLLRESLSYPEFIGFYRRLAEETEGMAIGKVHASCFAKEMLPWGVRCAAGVNKFSILPDGSVYPCNLFHGAQEFLLGNIFHDGLSSIWMNPKLSFFRTFRKNRCASEECSNKPSCTGGCPAHMLFHALDASCGDIRCGTTGRRSSPAA